MHTYSELQSLSNKEFRQFANRCQCIGRRILTFSTLAKSLSKAGKQRVSGCCILKNGDKIHKMEIN